MGASSAGGWGAEAANSRFRFLIQAKQPSIPAGSVNWCQTRTGRIMHWLVHRLATSSCIDKYTFKLSPRYPAEVECTAYPKRNWITRPFYPVWLAYLVTLIAFYYTTRYKSRRRTAGLRERIIALTVEANHVPQLCSCAGSWLVAADTVGATVRSQTPTVRLRDTYRQLKTNLLMVFLPDTADSRGWDAHRNALQISPLLHFYPNLSRDA